MERVFTLRKLPTNTTFSMFWENKEGSELTENFLTAPVSSGQDCACPPRLHSPVQCCLIKMPQGSTVKRLRAGRQQSPTKSSDANTCANHQENKDTLVAYRSSHPPTSLRAHILVIDPMLLVMVTSVALARSSLDTDSLFSFDIMLPKLTRLNQSP